MLKIGPNVWVTLHYAVSDAMGEPVGGQADTLTYLHGGYGAVFPAIEAALEGREQGDKLDLYLEPEDTFGEYDAELIRLEQRARFPEPLEPGLQFEGIPGDEGPVLIYTVTDLTDDVVVLDGNHPLAGMALRFAVEVMEVREATPEDIASETDKAAELASRLGQESGFGMINGHHHDHDHHHDHESGHDHSQGYGAQGRGEDAEPDADLPEGWRGLSRTLH